MGSQHQNMLHRISPNAVWRHTVGLMSRNFVAGLPDGSAEDFQSFITKRIGIVVVRSQVESSAIFMLKDYKKVFSDENYVVFCLN
jgi:hypothetical protein